ncbi:unnamed protein product, partial [Polarella glacialis]
MARAAWAELRTWMLRVHSAEGRVGAQAMEGAIDYQVSKRTASFHVPVNRVLALLLHHICVSSSSGAPGASRRPVSQIEEAFASVGMGAESDVLWWMEHSLRALVLHGQVSAGMWRRNGEVLDNENEFYRMNYWHHLLIDVDLLVLRMSALKLRPETFFKTLLMRLELGSWLQQGNPMKRLLAGGDERADEDLGLQKLQSFLLLLYQLLSAHTPLALSFRQLVTHTTRQYLSIAPKTYSQLWDPRLERSTATATAQDQQMLEAALREISSLSAADGCSGHSSAKYHLKPDQWYAVDPYFHLFSWSEQQKAEENLASAIKARGAAFQSWVEEYVKNRPEPLEVYRERFDAFCRGSLVQATVWLILVSLAYRPDAKDGGQAADSRLVVLALLVAIRSASASVPDEASFGESLDSSMLEPLLEDQVQVFSLAKAMGPHLCHTARRRFRVKISSASPSAEGSEGQQTIEVSLLDAVDRLASAPAESMSGGLARGLRDRLLSEGSAATGRSVPGTGWSTPRSASSARCGAASCNSSPALSPSSAADGDDLDEARRAKRRKAAQERQQQMLEDLKKRQAAFITGAVTSNGTPEESTSTECVICMAHQEGEDGDNPLGLLCYMRPAAASCLPRRRVPTEQAVLLQTTKSPLGGSSPARGPQCFEPESPDGLVLVRACSHSMHYSCWRRFRPAGLASGGGRL